jgi:hydrogenase/urease accessory protein HupE
VGAVRCFLTLLLFTAAMVLAPSRARAHEVGLSRGDYVVTASGVDVTLAFARREAISLLPALDGDRDGALSATEVEAQGTALAARTFAGLRITVGEASCEAQPAGARLVEEDGLAIHGAFRCATPPGTGAFTVAVPLLDDLSTGHRHLAKVGRDAVMTEAMLHRREPSFPVAALQADGSTPAGSEAPPPAVLAFFVIGIEHIVFGWDHVVFIIGLALVAGFGERRARGIFLAVTAFTLAHSITLGLAVLDVVKPPLSIIEPLIALSVAYVGVENFLVKDPGKRWRVTLPFGLVHGFGFAGALAEVGLPAGKTPAALALFNLGVEAGQLAILAVLLPVVFFLAKRPAYARWGVRVASGAIVLAGLFWFAERVIG